MNKYPFQRFLLVLHCLTLSFFGVIAASISLADPSGYDTGCGNNSQENHRCTSCEANNGDEQEDIGDDEEHEDCDAADAEEDEDDDDDAPRTSPTPAPTASPNGVGAVSGGSIRFDDDALRSEAVGLNPINPAKANAHRKVVDITTFGPAPISWARQINSREATHTTRYWEFGCYSNVIWQSSWQSNWNYELRTEGTASTHYIILRYPDGNEYNFYPASYPVGVGSQLVPEGAENGDRIHVTAVTQQGKITACTVMVPSGVELDFQRATSDQYVCHLLRKRNGLGWSWTCSWSSDDANGRLTKITNNFGRWIQIDRDYNTPDGKPRISQVSAGYGTTTERVVTYSYSLWSGTNFSTNYSILTGVDYPGGEHASYSYIASESGSSARPLLETAADPLYKGNKKRGGAGARINYVYSPFDSDIGRGALSEERNGQTGETIVGFPLGPGYHPRILQGDGTEIGRWFNSVNGVLTAKADGVATRRTTFIRDSNNQGFITSKIREWNGAVTQYARDNVGRVLTRTANNNTRQNRYNDYGFRTSHEDETPRMTTWTRNTTMINGFHNSRVTEKHYPDQTYETWSDFNGNSQPLTHRLRNGGTEHFTYDTFGNMTIHTDALGGVTTYEYYAETDPVNGVWRDRLKKIICPANASGLHASETYEYDRAYVNGVNSGLSQDVPKVAGRGLVTRITHADGTYQSFGYDVFGNKVWQEDELRHRTSYIYDEYNRVKTVKDPLQRTTTYEYGRAPGCSSCSYANTISRITSPSGRMTTFSYDGAGRVTCKTVVAPEDDVAMTSWVYNDVLNTVTRTDPRGKVWVDTYDDRHRKISSEDPLQPPNKTEWTYWENGKTKTEKRPGANTVPTQFFYDDGNRLWKVIDPANHTTELSYINGDKLFPLWKIKDANGHIYEFDYDDLDRKKSLKYPGESSVERYDYDPVGNLTTFTTRAGQVRTSTFDNRNREVHFEWNDDTPAMDKAYDAAGRLTVMKSWPSVLSFTYDEANQLTSDTQQVWPNYHHRSVVYKEYTPDGQRRRVYYPTGSEIEYDYTARGQVKTITEWPDHIVAKYRYDENGNRKDRTLENDSEEAYDYDDASRLMSIVHDGIASFAYDYNEVGTRKYVEREDGKGDVYSYDPIDQVRGVRYGVDDPSGSASGGNRDVSYTYDWVGNRTNVSDNWNSTGYTPNELNQYTAVGGDNPEYDGNGNLTRKGPWTYRYDAQNRLVSAWDDPVGYEFAYDGRNRCVRRTLWTSGEATVTKLYYDGWNLVEEQTDKDEFIARYVHGPQIDEIVKRATDNDAVYYHQDALGSTVALTDSNRTVVERYSYDIYGAPTFMDGDGNVVSSSASGNRFLFTGREYLAELDLYDYRNRVYSPEFGRFFQTDPLRFDGRDNNIYRYVFNSPVNYTDELGLIGGAQLGEDGRYHYVPDPTPLPPREAYPHNQIQYERDKTTSLIEQNCYSCDPDTGQIKVDENCIRQYENTTLYPPP